MPRFLSPNRGNGRSRNGRVRYGSLRYGQGDKFGRTTVFAKLFHFNRIFNFALILVLNEILKTYFFLIKKKFIYFLK